MKVWRLCKARWAGSAFTGEGAKKVGGRWNHKGTAVVYTAGSVSLAALELFVHLEPEDHPDDLVQISARLPEDASIRRIGSADLPRNWRDYPAPPALQDLGTSWARDAESLILALPSVMVPGEENYLVNPAHSEFSRVSIDAPKPFSFDPRMWK